MKYKTVPFSVSVKRLNGSKWSSFSLNDRPKRAENTPDRHHALSVTVSVISTWSIWFLWRQLNRNVKYDYFKKLFPYICSFYSTNLNGALWILSLDQSLTEKQVLRRNYRLLLYVRIPIGVRDGRDATLLLQVQFLRGLEPTPSWLHTDPHTVRLSRTSKNNYLNIVHEELRAYNFEFFRDVLNDIADALASLTKDSKF